MQCSANHGLSRQADQELSLQVAELTRERNSSRHQRYSSDRRRSHSRSRSVNRGSDICYYHRRYKEQARKLSSYGLKLNISKCVFGVTELIFLGHLITPDGIKPLPDKVQAVLDYKQPETVGSLRKFLGLLNFYRRFLPKAAEQQYLLSEFLKVLKEVHFTKLWTLSYSHWLSFPENLLHLKKSYSAYDRELLAIYSAIRHFRYMLEARDFTVFTDHKPLTYAFRQKSDKCSPRQIRQLDFISQFTTNIVHIQDLTILLLMFSLVFLQSPSQVKLTMTVLLRHNRLIQELHT
ncbi:retrovirus-related Pol polyprotein from transposon 17.6 [Trichonephila clavipes]|uniref:Retrovirus-related Pol polyprotein from transposon 17.6 n=1 Tax=Trichonephila clavipes TaxID=2585209 RepID=A0A8X7BDK5_TRICX|nr:retrovirus-related Pol polyprotein from transposon 17.6 [Trichonephila clavipes]